MRALSRWNGATRNRYRAAITHFWRWARQREYAELRPELEGAKEQSRDAVLDLPTIRRLYEVAPARGDWQGFCRLLILTGQRRGEVSGIRSEQVEGRVWRQPCTKNGTQHLVHLIPRAMDELRGGVTWEGKTGFTDLKTRWSRDADIDPETWRFHDLRRSYATHLVEGGADPVVVDRVLNHVASATAGGVARIYNRAALLGDREKMMGRWEGMLFPPKPKPEPMASSSPVYKFELPKFELPKR
jgi:integrase